MYIIYVSFSLAEFVSAKIKAKIRPMIFLAFCVFVCMDSVDGKPYNTEEHS